MNEREHWLSITDDPGWKRNYISDPNISLTETVDAVVAAFPSNPVRVVEIGCGYGRLSREIRERFPLALVWGLDVNPKVLAEARRYDEHTTFVCDDTICAVPDVDAIYSVAVFQHLPDSEKRAYITQAYDALTEGGVIRIQFIEGVRDNHLDHWTPEDQMIDWFNDAGFDVAMQTGLAHPRWTWITGTK